MFVTPGSRANRHRILEPIDQPQPTPPPVGRAILGSFNQQGFSVPHWWDPQGNAIELTRDNMFIALNTTGSTITKGRAVYISGHDPSHTIPKVALAKADFISTMPCVGLAFDSIANNGYGRVMTLGTLENIDMSAFNVDDQVFLSPVVAGGLLNSRPAKFAQFIGIVLNNNVAGALLIKSESRPDVHYESPNAQTGTSYTFLGSDHGRLVTFSNASPVAVTLPQAGPPNFVSGWNVDCTNKGAGTVTITPSVSTINGAATYTLTTGQSVRIVSDASNYQITAVGVTSPSSLGLSDGTTVEDIGGTLTAVPVTNGVFNFRLTLVSGTAVTTTDQTGKSTIYLTPYNGNRVDLYDGTRWQRFSSAEVSIAIGTVVPYQAYDVFAYNNAGTLTLEILEWANAAVTFTSATPTIVTWTGHGMSTGNSVTFTTTGAMPTGVSANTQYFVTVVDANTFKISTTLANVAAGTFVATSSTGSNCIGHQPQARQTAITLQDGVYVKSGTTTRRLCGTFLADSTTTTSDAVGKRFLSNANNPLRRPLHVQETAFSWTLTNPNGAGFFQQANANTANKVEGVISIPLQTVDISASEVLGSSHAGDGVAVAIGEDSAKTPPTNISIGINVVAVVNVVVACNARYVNQSAVGYHGWYWLDACDSVGAGTGLGERAQSAGNVQIQSGLTGWLEA